MRGLIFAGRAPENTSLEIASIDARREARAAFVIRGAFPR